MTNFWNYNIVNITLLSHLRYPASFANRISRVMRKTTKLNANFYKCVCGYVFGIDSNGGIWQ